MADTTRPYTTTDAGIPAPSDEFSLTAGDQGPILLQDHYLIQKMAQFNRERVPERVVHAKGTGAHGFFETTEDVSQFTKASMFQPGARGPRCSPGSPPSPASRATPTPPATPAGSR